MIKQTEEMKELFGTADFALRLHKGSKLLVEIGDKDVTIGANKPDIPQDIATMLLLSSVTSGFEVIVKSGDEIDTLYLSGMIEFLKGFTTVCEQVMEQVKMNGGESPRDFKGEGLKDFDKELMSMLDELREMDIEDLKKLEQQLRDKLGF